MSRDRTKHARRAGRVPRDNRDANEDAIVDAIIACGGRVQKLSQAGVPDLAVWVGAAQRWILVEVKGEKGSLTAEQVKFRDHFGASSRFVVRTPDEAIDIMQAIRRNTT